jgi:hypothetical protein
MKKCQCGDPEALGTHWEEEDGNCCPDGCECLDCKWWRPYKNLEVT